MRTLRIILMLVPLAALFVAGMGARNAGSLPLFARKYKTPCTTCHVAFPRLNSFGMHFKQNGYRMPGEVGESPWDSSSTFPLSVVGNVGYAYTGTDSLFATTTGRRGNVHTSAFVQNASEFHSAGTLAPNITFHFDNNFAGVNGPLTSGQAFVQFDDLAKDGVLNVKAGVYDADIFYLADSRRTTLSHYLSPVTLAGYGVELNGTRSGWIYAAGLNNSARAAGKPRDMSLNNFENVYAWLTREVGDQMVTARVFLDQQDPRDTTKSSAQHFQGEFNAFLNRGRLIVIPGVTFEQFADANLAQRDKAETLLLETMVLLDSNRRWTFTGRYELRHMPQFSFQGATAFPEEDDAMLTGDVAYMANPNCRIALEYVRTQDNVQGPRVNQIQAYVHLAY
jgi:hypothetical protein